MLLSSFVALLLVARGSLAADEICALHYELDMDGCAMAIVFDEGDSLAEVAMQFAVIHELAAPMTETLWRELSTARDRQLTSESCEPIDPGAVEWRFSEPDDDIRYSVQLREIERRWQPGSIAVLLTVYRREHLKEQLTALKAQSIPPSAVYILQNENHIDVSDIIAAWQQQGESLWKVFFIHATNHVR